MALVPASNPQLPILPLEQPLLLLPGSRISLPVSKDQARSIIALVQENAERGSATGNVLGAAPLLSADSDNIPKLSQWGCSGRIIRLTRPSPLQPSQPFTLVLHGLTRFTFVSEPVLTTKDLSGPLKRLSISYPPLDSDAPPKAETVQTFKTVALKLLDRLAQEAANASPTLGGSTKRSAWLKLSDMVQEVTDDRVASFADVMVGAINGEYIDKLGYLSTSEPEARLVLATELFTKQTSIAEVSNKISTAVSESLSKQQKEFFLRQQLSAIQKELASLHGADKVKSKGTGELDLDDDDQNEIDDLAELKRKIEAMVNGSEEKKMGAREYRRLKRIPQGSVEQGVLRSYLEWLTSLPWPTTIQTEEEKEQAAAVLSPTFLRDARAQLDSDHFGLEKIKKRLVEYLAIVRLKHMNALRAKHSQEVSARSKNEQNAAGPSTSTSSPTPSTFNRAPILLFVGPPGVGKTSLGQSVAKALHRPFQRISLGGVRDEAEIRGHRRTYVASGPGTIVQALRKAGRRDPILLLDEIDKVGGSNFQGDPSAALLEVLDPEQNWSFRDHYINVPIDLSGVLFICTANSIEGISGPLLDRCEVIHLSGYTYDEKMSIAKKFLVPKQMKVNGMVDERSHEREDNGRSGMVEMTDEALECIATLYTREAGVRSLERVIGAVVRSKAVEWSERMGKGGHHAEEGQSLEPFRSSPTGDIVVDARIHDVKDSSDRAGKEWNPVVRKEDLEPILGPPRWDGEEKDREERRGVVWGLVVMGMGEGAIMPVESIAVPGSGSLKLTGSLGDVIKESGELALSWVKTHAYALHVTNKPSEDPLKLPDPIDVHLHLPAGAQRKDGPSAGVAMVCAFVSLLTGATVPTYIAMTGEITLRGRVTAVGGIKEKILGAHRAKVRKVILPFANRQDVEQDVPKEIKAQVEFAFVRTLEEALREAFGSQLDWRARSIAMESRL